MAEDVEQIVNELYRVIDSAKSVPFSAENCVINREEVMDLIDEIRSKFPDELKRAQEMVHNREAYIERTKSEVARMLMEAELDVKAKVSESEITRAVREKGREIIRHAEERSREMYRIANEYTEDALRRTEEAITEALQEVKQSRVRFRAASNEIMQRKREALRAEPKDGKKEEEKSEEN